MAEVYVRDIGDMERVYVRFYALDTDALADPTTAVVIIRTPAKGETAYAAIREATGVYYYDLYLTADGDWYYRGYGTGDVVAAAEHYLTVRESAFDNPLATP